MSDYDLMLTTFRIRFDVARRLAAAQSGQNLAGFRLKVSRGQRGDCWSPNDETPER